MKIYNKLVRDNIPDIIAATGATCEHRTLTTEEYLDALNAKLDEEVAEYHESGSIEELADILEVIYAIAAAKGCPVGELDSVQFEKAAKRGRFDKRIMLISVQDLKTDTN